MLDLISLCINICQSWRSCTTVVWLRWFRCDDCRTGFIRTGECFLQGKRAKSDANSCSGWKILFLIISCWLSSCIVRFVGGNTDHIENIITMTPVNHLYALSTCQFHQPDESSSVCGFHSNKCAALPAVHVFITTDLLCLKTWMSRTVTASDCRTWRDILTPGSGLAAGKRDLHHALKPAEVKQTSQSTLLQPLPAEL